jgi:hypothetical protein
MALRPVAFSIPSTTELKITFSDTLSEQISKDNFEVESLSGAVSDLDVTGVTLDGKVALVKTRPHVSGNYYLLKFIDTSDVIFASEKGVRLLDSSISRELFFVGIDKVNPIRDRMLREAPQLFDVENSSVRHIISAQAEEMYRAQIAIGRNLSNNYISIDVEDEFRTRGPGATDRMANENAYEVVRVADKPTSALSKYTTLDYTDSNSYEDLQEVPFFPISLQQTLTEDEEISSSSQGSSFDGFLLSLTNPNVIRVLSVTYIRNGEAEDCDGNLGTAYNLDIYKYTVLDNTFDQRNGFSFTRLENNQVLLSEFGNIPRPTSLDTIKITYLYKDLGKFIIEDTIEVTKVIEETNKSVPSNSISFFLDNAPIVNAINEVCSTKGGVKFRLNENSTDTPPEFATELLYGVSRMPSSAGEYSINYETGEVFVMGVVVGDGTGRNNYVMDYDYRKTFLQDIDYSVSEQKIVGHPDRDLIGQEAEISFNYDQAFAEGTDFIASSHIEVINEQVKNKLTGSFSITTDNAPITDVFRILNQTTGEVYNLLYHTDTEVYFSGNRSPQIINIESEIAKFDRVTNEELEVIGKFVVPAFEFRITSNASNNSIMFEPGIPSELISFNSNSYYVRVTDTNDDGELTVDDLQVRFFGDPDAENLISSFAISATAAPPSNGTTAILGTLAYQIYLDNEGIMNKNLDAVGSLINKSIVFSDSTVFGNEKYFAPLASTNGIDSTENGGLSKIFTAAKTTDFYDNMTRLRKVGDYVIDYVNGVVYVAIDTDQDIFVGKTSYNYYGVKARNGNVFHATGATKKLNSPDLVQDARVIYDDLINDTEIIKLLDLESTISLWDGETEAGDLDGDFQTVFEILDDYTVVLPYDISAILTINKVTDLTGTGLSSSIEANREPEASVSSLLSTLEGGGKNIYDPTVISYEKNVIDLKTTKDRRVYVNGDGDFAVTIYDANIETFYSAILLKTDIELFDDKLNITKISDVKILAAEVSGSEATVYVSTSELDDVDTTADYLLDSDGNRFLITAVNTALSTITVDSPAVNNVTATAPELDSSGSETTIVVKPAVTIAADSITVVIPSDAPINSGDLIRFVYLTSIIPDVGTPLAIDYRYGHVYADYTYIKDRLAISYEYGDNSLDWSISDTLSEGESYYVTYKYGAGREALRANFGSLTNIPFFDTFPLSIDRELYRSAIAGTLQTFPKGPTTPAFKELVKSFTDINPEIAELAFGNWILGRDYLHVAKPEFEGDLNFRDGKFEDGLLFQPDTTVNIPAISSLSLEEGTVEGWVRPSWSGIDNDADIIVSIDNIGTQKFFTDPKDKLFDKGWDLNDTDAVGGTDDVGLGFRFFNYRADEAEASGISLGRFLLKNSISHYTESADSTQRIRMKIPFAAIRYGADETIYNLNPFFQVATFGMVDGTKVIGGEFALTRLFQSDFVSSHTIASSDLPDYERPHYLRSCACSITNNIPALERFNSELIEIDFGSEVDFSPGLDGFFLIDNGPQSMVLIDETGTHWQVMAFLDDDGDTITGEIPESVRKVYVDRFPINDRHLSGLDVGTINASLPSGAFNLYVKTFRANTESIIDSTRAFGIKEHSVVNWSEYMDIKIVKKLANNLVDVKIKRREYNVFYHELTDVSDVQFSEVTALSNGSMIGAIQPDVYVEAHFFRNRITINNRYSLSNIYIGQDGYNPTSNPFTINREDSPLYALGLPRNIDSDDGIFIGFDELCISPISEEVGQWVFKARATRGVKIPESVTFSGGSYTSNFTTYEVDHKFSGELTTDGAFSSVVRAHRLEAGDCVNGLDCTSHFRYCGEELLENVGWVNIEEVNSALINTILGGRETFYEPWVKVGTFDTSVSDGIYRLTTGSADDYREENGNYLYSRVACDGNVEIITSMRATDIPETVLDYELGLFSGAVSGVLLGITPIALVNRYGNFKVTLGMTIAGEALIVLYDGIAGRIVDYVSFDWNDDSYHEYKIVTNTTTGTLQLYADDYLLSQVTLSEFDENTAYTIGTMELHLIDRDIIDIDDFVATGQEFIIDIDLVEYHGNDSESDPQLEDTDIFINTEAKIQFEFNIDVLDGYDAYDGYDGYIDAVTGTDEIFFSADRPKYFIDSGAADHSGRISLFKDGKGFLNFRIYDDALDHGDEVGMYNLATNIKHWVGGELHHIAASWKLNSIDEKDEMHLFVDGIEAPNIYKFGGTVPLVVNAKFSDVSKEALHNFLTNYVDFCDTYNEGTVVAGSTTFSSSELTFTDSMIGRSILIVDSDIGENLIGGEYIIKSVVGGAAILGTGSGIETVIFSVSASDIEFKFPPTSGITTPVLTDLRNSKFTIYHTNSAGVVEELGGILYEVSDGEIDIISGSNIEKPKYRANLDTRVIEFVGENSACETVETVSMSDIDIHLETFGLSLQRCKQLVDLSASSYLTDGSAHSGKSVLRLYGSDPLSLSDVSIIRVVMDRTVVEIGDIEEQSNGNYLADFEITLDAESKKVSSEVGRVNKQNLGRVIKVWYDSDNTVFCETDGYTDGYTVSGENLVTVYGLTTDGSNEESFIINKNGYFEGSKFFTRVDRVVGQVIIADPDYFELGMLAIEEVNNITVSDNNGDYAEIFEFQSGTYTITAKGSNGTFPFELHAGKYRVEYPSYLRLNVPRVGEKLFIGSDRHGELSWDGVIDEFRIISEMSSDTRNYETYTSGTRSITKDYNTTDVFCADEQTLALIHFDNPISKQNRKLRTKEYLDEYNNVKYKLSTSQREKLLALAGDGDAFVSAMINMGFAQDESEKTYFETLYAENGPIINDAEYYNNFSETQISSESVNDVFGKSGYFKSGPGLLYDNDPGYFRSSEGSIEFWVSPILDTKVDKERRYFVDIADVTRERIKSKSSSIIDLNSAASQIISVKLLTSAARYEGFYTAEESSSILFDEIARSEISGRLEGGTGTDKDFGVGAKLSANGKVIYLAEVLPGQNIDVVITYVPLDSSGDRVSVFKNEYSQIVFGITADGTDHIVSADVNWKKNTWHRVMCMYKTGTKSGDTMRIFVDGKEGGLIRYGTGLIYGTGYIYGQYAQREGQAKSKDYRIELGSDFRILSVGSDIYGDNTARSRMDNLRFSSIMRNTTRDSLGNFIDTNYSSNIETIYPVIEDDSTTFILEFDVDGEKVDKFATVIDPVNGIFDFDIDVIDNFDKVIGINDGEVEDLITDLVNRLKPAHANALVKFTKSKC